LVFITLALLSIAFSIQYFEILAPADLCPTRPHYDFLWTSVDGKMITHCMSGTEEINERGPYYFYPSIVQSWLHIVWPIITTFFLFRAWSVWRSAGT
jgi:hypothetical protein